MLAETLTPAVEVVLHELYAAHYHLRAQEEHLRNIFKELLAPYLKVGAIVDILQPGPAHRAYAVQGRSYGNFFRIEGEVTIKVDTVRPSLSRWMAKAISIKDPGAKEIKTMGKPFSLAARVVPGPLGDDLITDEAIVLNGVEWLRSHVAG